MRTKFIGFVFMLSLIVSSVWAQDEVLLIEDESATAAEEDIFSGDFFSDLDSFLGENTNETTSEEAIINETLLEPVSTQTQIETSSTENLQSSATVNSSSLPSSAQVTLTVTNVSQDNADAVQSGARPGDVLRYEVMLTSNDDDVVNYRPTINVAAIESVVEFTNTGFGVRENGLIVYPAYSHQAPCTQAFTFFVRVLEDCADMTSLNVSAPQAGNTVVPLNCGLAQTGPSQKLFLMVGIIMIFFTLLFAIFNRRRSS